VLIEFSRRPVRTGGRSKHSMLNAQQGRPWTPRGVVRYGRETMAKGAQPRDSKVSAAVLAEQVDFYQSWQMVDSATSYSATARARAFAIWVALFGFVTPDGTVTLNSAEIAEEFSVSRVSWKQYRELLEQVGLIEQGRVASGPQRPTVVRLLPPLRG
jgi:hypothetical protein